MTGGWVRILSLVLFASVALSVVGGAHYYLWARLVRDPAWPVAVSRLLTVAIVALGLLIPVAGFIFRGNRIVSWAAFIWMGAMFMLFIGTVLGELVRVPALLTHPDRREFLARGFALVVGAGGLGMTAFGIRRALQALRVKEVEVKLTKLSEGLVIAQLTDIHVGPTIRKDFIEAMVEKTNALSPDIIAITGDLVDGSVEELREHTAPLAKLKAKYGVFFVTGNHEYYSGHEQWIAEVQRLGIRVLQNERVGAGPVDVVGINDYTAHQFGHAADLPKALQGGDASRPTVLLAHQPRAVKEAATLGVSLQLSGHTHAGQIWPWGYAVKLQAPWVVGLYQELQTQLYVSPGTGYWGPPLRVGTQAEITKLVLRPA